MEILGIGLPELVFIFLVAIIIMGPKDMQKTGRTVGIWLRKVVTSDGWKIFQQTSRELRTLPNRLMREANEDLQNTEAELRKSISAPPPTREISRPERSQPVMTIDTPQTPPAVQPTNESDPNQNA